ncbi:MAG TPA: MFS transporter [Alphaproteobacteria bacterium]
MTTRLAPIAALLAGTFIFLLGNGLLGTLLSLRLNIAGQPTEVAGIVGSAYFVGLIAGCFRAVTVIGAVGHIRAFAVFAAVSASVSLAFALSDDPLVWIVLRVLSGFAIAGLFTVIESWLNVTTDNAWRGRILSIYMVTIYSALGLGQFLLLTYDLEGFQPFSVIAMLFAMSLVPVSLSRVPAPEIRYPSILPFRQLYRLSPLGVVGCFGSGLMLAPFYSLAPIFAQNLGLSVDEIALLMSAAIIGGLVVQWPIGRLSDVIDRRRVLTASVFAVALAGGAIMLLSIFPRPPMLFYVAGAVFCLGFVIYPLSVGHANDHITDEDRVAMSGGLLIAYSVGAAIGPVLAAFTMQHAGDHALFGFIGVVALLIGLFALWRMKRRAPVPIAEQGSFQAMPRTSPVAHELDPAADTSSAAANQATGDVAAA